MIDGMVIGQLAASTGLSVRTLRLQRAVLRAVARSTDPKELERMTDLTTLTAEERRRILDDYLDAVFGEHASPIADRLRMGAPELPEAPTADQVASWVELTELLRNPDYVQVSRQMAERARAEGSEPDDAHHAVQAVGQYAGAAVRGGIDPRSREALAVIERVEAMTPGDDADRAQLADRIAVFADRRVLRYWTLVGIVNGWTHNPVPEDAGDAWQWYAHALRAHA